MKVYKLTEQEHAIAKELDLAEKQNQGARHKADQTLNDLAKRRDEFMTQLANRYAGAQCTGSLDESMQYFGELHT